MQVPSLKTWEVDTLVDADDLNTHIKDAMNFFKRRPYVHLTRANSQPSISSGAWNLIPWASFPLVDNDGMFDNSEPQYVTIQTPGLYAVTAALMFTTYGSPGIRGVSIDYVPGDGGGSYTVIGRGGATCPNADPYDNVIGWEADAIPHACAVRTQAFKEMRTGDRFRVAGYHDAGSTSGAEPGPYADGPGHTQSYFAARWVAALVEQV